MPPVKQSVLSEFMAITHPILPAPIPTLVYFTTNELSASTGILEKTINAWVRDGLLIPSIERGIPGRARTSYTTHKFSERDLLIAGAISCLSPYAHVERRRLSAALYASPALHRYVLITKAATRFFDSLSSFADPTEWSHPILQIIDLRTLWKDIERRFNRYALKSFKKTTELEKDRPFARLTLPTGDSARRVGD